MTGQRTDSSILALIGAFTSGLDVFKRLKHRKRRKEEQTNERAESRLSRSLSKGPLDLQQKYDRGYSLQGEKFREGDSKAHASLAAVLLKLNNGLVSFIQSFLHGGRRGAHLDYETLTSLSELSRLEAVDALSQLSYRLSESSLSLLRPMGLPEKTHSKKTVKRKDLYNDGNTAIIRRMQASNGSASQLAMVKPRSKRTVSDSKIKTRASSPKSPLTPPATPPGELPPSSKPHNKKLASNRSSPNLNYQFHHGLPTPPSSPPQYTAYEMPQQRPTTSAEGGGRDPLLEDLRRRQHKATPSTWTFASDSTKLGEIPMDRWNTPYNFDEMARLNAEAALKPREQPPLLPPKQKRGFFSRFKRGNADDS